MPFCQLTTMDLPIFPRSEVAPELPAAIYPTRVERLRERATARGYDQVVVYAGRERSANFSYLARVAPLPVDAGLFQELNLPSQPRNRSKTLVEVLADAGVRRGSRAGVVGWKTGPDRSWMNAPDGIPGRPCPRLTLCAAHGCESLRHAVRDVAVAAIDLAR
jgi:hypothetical protein